jgi:hypothetical protein
MWFLYNPCSDEKIPIDELTVMNPAIFRKNRPQVINIFMSATNADTWGSEFDDGVAIGSKEQDSGH